MADDQTPPERPRAEPEILPPDRSGGGESRAPWQRTWQTSWGQDGTRYTQRVFVMQPGPFSYAILLLALLLIVGTIVITVIGAFLIWIPVVVLLVAIGAVYRFLRR